MAPSELLTTRLHAQLLRYVMRPFCKLHFATFPGQIHTYWQEVIIGGYLFDSTMWNRFEELINNSIWPSGIGRLPDNVRSRVLMLKDID